MMKFSQFFFLCSIIPLLADSQNINQRDKTPKSYQPKNVEYERVAEAKRDSLLREDTINGIDFSINKALALKLADSKQWRDLLHFGRWESEIDSLEFFYAPNGKKDAESELIATIKAFYTPIDLVEVPKDFEEKVSKTNALLDSAVTSLPRRSAKKQDYHAICRFPARFFYLNSVLNFENLPQVECEEFHQMRDYVNPKSATLIFPSAHINSPASMFGHTFLLLNSGFNSRLLSFAINYQAAADEKSENGLAFAYKGLLGFYEGRYSILPYYDKIKEYRDSENRDIWEFDLNLTIEEIAQMYRHIWELGDVWAWYYFFDENCSYNMLWLLEVARPSLNLRKKFVYQVNPPETLHIINEAGLIEKETFRPSKRTKLLEYERYMSFGDVRKAKKIALGKIEPETIAQDSVLSLSQKQFILESSIEMSEYWYMKGKLEKEQYTDIAHKSALERSNLGASTALEPPLPSSPLKANQGLRLSPMYFYHTGFNSHNARNATNALGLDFRLTYHDITDNDLGYLKGAQIEFLKVLAYAGLDSKNNQILQIHQATLLSIGSFAGVSKFFTPFSYRMDLGASRQFLTPHLRAYASFGGGVSKNIGRNSYAYYLFEPTFYFNAKNKADFLLANVLGFSLSNDARLKFNTEYKFRAYGLRTFGHYVTLSASVNLIHNLGLFTTLEYNLVPNDYTSTLSIQSGARIYF
ncbi:DUF4105 domain-containing protein [Helicobacter himalayensis]|uniref:Lnb N-terminal periplasmic domain-containing protein n=1 Tax=Helicobacter himalayensis TaxID=1591088 RepID=UPI000AB6EDBB|nr:DUF4105 domain-containing protein [Helicobacter himalayensis]